MEIKLYTGYTINTDKDDWQVHLITAIIGECLITPKHDLDVEERFKILMDEAYRICKTYDLNYFFFTLSICHRIDQSMVTIKNEDCSDCKLKDTCRNNDDETEEQKKCNEFMN